MLGLYRGRPVADGGHQRSDPVLAATFWVGPHVTLAAAPQADGRTVHLGLYPTSDLAGLILRIAGFVAEGPHAAPDTTMTWEQLTGQEPSPGSGVPEAWRVRPEHLWHVVAAVPGGRPSDVTGSDVTGSDGADGEGQHAETAALQVLTVPGTGHYRLAPDPGHAPGHDGGPPGFRLHTRSGLALFHDLRALCRHAAGG